MDLTYAVYWNIHSSGILFYREESITAEKFTNYCLKSALFYEKIIFNFVHWFLLETQRFKDFLLLHCYLQVLYFTPAFLIFLCSILLYFLLNLAKFRPLEVLERTTLKYVFNLVNCNCGNFNFCTAIGGQCTINNPSVSNSAAAWDYGWCKNCEFRENFRHRPTNAECLCVTSSFSLILVPSFRFMFSSILSLPLHFLPFAFPYLLFIFHILLYSFPFYLWFLNFSNLYVFFFLYWNERNVTRDYRLTFFAPFYNSS